MRSQVPLFATKILSKCISGNQSIHFKKEKYEITQAALIFSLFKSLLIDFPERQTCKDFSGKDINLDSDWLAVGTKHFYQNEMPTKIQSLALSLISHLSLHLACKIFCPAVLQDFALKKPCDFYAYLLTTTLNIYLWFSRQVLTCAPLL